MHMPRRDKAAEYRRLAEENREVARWISLNHAREQLLEAARQLEILAEAEDRRAQGVTREGGGHFA